MWIDHHEKIWKLMFQALALCQSKYWLFWLELHVLAFKNRCLINQEKMEDSPETTNENATKKKHILD